jgi:Flp pilus assembly protein TadG
MVEFAFIAPILLLFLFGVVDFGRIIYTYITLNQAVNEGARVAVRASPLLPSDVSVETAVKSHAVDVVLANPCPNGPISTPPDDPANNGWVFITEPDPPGGVEQLRSTKRRARQRPMQH